MSSECIKFILETISLLKTSVTIEAILELFKRRLSFNI